MIVVNKAILHVFDTSNMQAVLSDTALILNNELTSFLEEHIRKCFHKVSSKPGVFLETSIFNKYLQDYLQNDDFVGFSKAVAGIWFDVIRQANGVMPSDLFVCDVLEEDIRNLVFLRIGNQHAYIRHTTMSDGIVCNEIQTQSSLPTGTAEEFATFRVKDETLLISQKKYDIDGNSIYALSEAVMECVLKSSQQETINAIKKTAVKIAEDFGADMVQTAASVKNAIARELEDKETLNPVQLGNCIFSEQPALQEAFQQKMQDSGFSKDESVTVNKETLLKKVMNHRLKTDTGIELTIPAEYFDNTDFIEFNHAEDGSLSITLKHISSIVNRG
ncbi:MAG: nucleoid-associated protein [Schwartzia sp.]|nr:nucleoid-associated protein [Schwartzia sp. (in: firmicutes)]